jgi:hypothetical protein
MVDAKGGQPTDVGELASDPPVNIGTSDVDHLRMINRSLATLNENISKLARPPPFRLADVLALFGAIVVLAIAALGAWGLSDRINHVDDHVDRVEDKISAKLDKLSDQITRMDERTSAIEGQLQGKKR